MVTASTAILTGALLERCRVRAPVYDRENRFFQEDFDDLKAAGYLQMAVPKEFGGLGFSLVEVGRETRRLAQYAPATALALNMHNYWVGDAADAWRGGDKSLEWILREAAGGESSRPATPSTATTFRASCPRRRRSASTAAIGSPAARRSAA